MRLHAVVVSLEPVLRSPAKEYDTKDIGRLLIDYWSAWRDLVPEAFDNPADYVIQKTVGLYGLHMVFPRVFELCRAAGDFSEEKMKDILGNIRDATVSEFWNKHNTKNAWVMSTSMKALRAFAEHLKEQLPTPKLPRIKTK